MKNNETLSKDYVIEVGSSIMQQQFLNIVSILLYSLIVRKINSGFINQTDTWSNK